MVLVFKQMSLLLKGICGGGFGQGRSPLAAQRPAVKAGIPRDGFPAFRGVIFWQDFVQWRAGQNGFKSPPPSSPDSETVAAASKLPPRAAQILLDA